MTLFLAPHVFWRARFLALRENDGRQTPAKHVMWERRYESSRAVNIGWRFTARKQVLLVRDVQFLWFANRFRSKFLVNTSFSWVKSNFGGPAGGWAPGRRSAFELSFHMIRRAFLVVIVFIIYNMAAAEILIWCDLLSWWWNSLQNVILWVLPRITHGF